MNEYAYYIKDNSTYAIVKWDESNGRRISPNKTEVDSLYFEYTKEVDLLVSMVTPSFATALMATETGLHPNVENALVYYIKAKEFERNGDLKAREYFMRLVRRQIGKYSRLSKGSVVKISSGKHAIR